MTNGKIEPQDADTLLRIYRKIAPAGFTLDNLTIDEQVLIYALAKAISEGKIINAED